ncbi:hypothetical protein [Croceicoccus marinus]|uniref:Uncharacterized protein n=1 Tax=Croceicoccus marinus TaxID=450378 RepID=A0A7G6VWY1_9SPHN|nr:hypothetical protein [Croceicoccus marinus]QNE06246.1 hypothetical protein H4O24_06465 [Croceicoccus marinus]
MALFGKRRKKAKRTTQATDENGLPGFSPNPMTNLILTDIALRGVSRIARRVTEQKMLSKRYSKENAKKVMAGRSVGETLLAAAVARAATRSVPGAVVIGGGLLAKALYDRRKGHSSKIEGRKALHKRIAEAED